MRAINPFLSTVILLIFLAQTTYADVPSPPVLKWGYSIIFLWLIYVVIVTGLTLIKSSLDRPQEHIETQKKSLWERLFIIALAFVAILSIIIFAMFFYFVIGIYLFGDYLIFLSIFTIIGIACGKAAIIIFKGKTNSLKQNKGLTTFLVILIIASQILILSYGLEFRRSAGHIRSRDWNKLQPLTPTVYYTGSQGTFNASFNNVGGTSAKITNIAVNESYSGQLCRTYTINGNSIGSGVSVSPGSLFEVGASECPVLKRDDQYLMIIAINYNSVVGGINTPHTEIGEISGSAA